MVTQKITIEPVTRIEGHAKVTVHMKEDGSDYTIYDKPFMSNQEIANDINEQISEYAECSVEPFDGMKYFDDFERIVYNTTNEAFMPFDFLTQNAEIFNKANIGSL